jgi:hypothetical protein
MNPNPEDPSSPTPFIDPNSSLFVTEKRTGPYGIRISTRERREGFQMTRERRQSNAEWPAWLNRAWNTPIDEVGAMFPASKVAGQSQIQDERIALNVPSGSTMQRVRVIEWNDWIIREPDGRLWVTDSTDPVIANIEVAEPPVRHATPEEEARLMKLFRPALTGRVAASQAAIDQVAESLCSLVGDDGRFREDIRRILRENFGEIGTNEFAELEKLRGYYRQIVATLGRDDVIACVQKSEAAQVELGKEIGALNAHADRLATALEWLREMTCDNHPGVIDALRAHAMRRGADFQDAGPIQSEALLPAHKVTRGFVFYPGGSGKRGVLVTQDVIPERTKLVFMASGSLYHVHSAFSEFGVTVAAVSADPCLLDTGEGSDHALDSLIAVSRVPMTPAEAMRRTSEKIRDLVSEGNHGHALAAPILSAEVAPALYGALDMVQPRKPLPPHPVDAMKAVGVKMTPEAEAEMRAHCDALVPVVRCFSVPACPEGPHFWGPDDVIAYACDEAGKTLSSHYCSSVDWARRDIVHETHQQNFRRRYPAGYVTEWVGEPPVNWDRGVSDATDHPVKIIGADIIDTSRPGAAQRIADMLPSREDAKGL